MTVRQESCGRWFVYGPMDTTKIQRDTRAHYAQFWGDPGHDLPVGRADTLLAVCDTEEEARAWNP